MNVLAIIDENITACESYRIIIPLEYMVSLGTGHNGVVMKARTFVENTRWRQDDTLGADIVLFNRLFVMSNQTGAFRDQVANMRARGIGVIVDYDDDYTNAHRIIHPGDLPDLRMFSAVTVSTEVLRQEYGGMNKHIYVIPNALDSERFHGWDRALPESKTVVGLSGSVTHRTDWQPAALALAHLLEERDDFVVFVSGFMPDELAGRPGVLTPRDVVDTAGITSLKVTDDGLRLPFPQYGWLLRQCDILLAPVDPDDKFNWCKSNLKAIEGMSTARHRYEYFPTPDDLGGCAVIATGGRLPIYKNIVRHMETGLLVSNHHDYYEWKTHIARLLDSPAIRRALQEAGYRAAQYYWIANRIHERISIYETIAARAKRHAGLKEVSDRVRP